MIDASTASCPISRLPLEVLLRIAWHLPTPGLCNLRLTSRPIEQALSTSFIKEFFTIKQFMIHEISLKALIDISKSRMGPHLRSVHISLELVPSPRPPVDTRQKHRQSIRFHETCQLWDTGAHRDMLAEAFRNLPNLESVVIRDFNSTRRSRDGWGYEWTAYGNKTLSRDIGIHLSPSPRLTSFWNITSPIEHVSKVFAAVITALGQAGARPKGIEVMSRNKNELEDSSFSFPSYLESTYLPVLQNLERLHLAMDFMRGPYSGSVFPGDFVPLEDLTMLQKFLLKTTNLKDLRINVMGRDCEPLVVLLRWLAQQPPAPGQPSLVPLPTFPLEEFSLGMLDVSWCRLVDLAKRFAPTLKSLVLWKITLVSDVDDRHERDLRDTQDKINLWSEMLQHLIKVPGLELHHIKLGALNQRNKDSHYTSRIHFGPGAHVLREYTGPDWRRFIQHVIQTVEVDYVADELARSAFNSQNEHEDDGVWDLYALDIS